MSNSTQGDYAQETAAAFTYDAWGRTSTQTVGPNSATDSCKYGSKLASVTSTLFGEADVTFEYGGDQKRRSMTTGGVTTQYNWDMGWNVINEEDGTGARVCTYTHNTPEAAPAGAGQSPTCLMRPAPKAAKKPHSESLFATLSQHLRVVRRCREQKF